MWYREALAIGRAQGTIQCTYAIIYDQDGKKLFALQRLNPASQKAADIMTRNGGKESDPDSRSVETWNLDLVDTSFGQEGIIAWQQDVRTENLDRVDTGYIVFDLPLVIAEEHSNDRLVPVRLDANAVLYIQNTLWATKTYTGYELYTKDLSRVIDSGKSNPNYWGKTYTKDGVMYVDTKRNGTCIVQALLDYRKPHWAELIRRLNADEVFYVKPAAFDWQPIDVSHMNNGSNPEWVRRKDEAYAKLQKSKKMLMLAGLSNIL